MGVSAIGFEVRFRKAANAKLYRRKSGNKKCKKKCIAKE